MSRKHVPMVLLSSLLAVACGDEVDEICGNVEDCEMGVDETQCLNSLGVYDYSAECLEIMVNATCEDHRTSSYWDNCWEPCREGDTQHCEEHTLVNCDDDGFKVRLDCERGCEAAGMPYGGACGSVSPMDGEISERDVCWCVIYQ